MAPDPGPRDAASAAPQPSLRRALGLWSLVLYGLATIVGAGIYVLIGAVAGRAGMAAPFAFLLAGTAAALTGLCFAELVARLPEAAGEAAYVQEAFGSPTLSRAVGFGVLFVAVVSAASIAKGGAGYLQHYLPVPAWLAEAGIVVVFTWTAAAGVVAGVRIAVVLSVVEIAGLCLVIGAGAAAPAEDAARLADMWPRTADVWAGVGAGAFLAFFAFIGFDVLANMAEETRDVRRILPRAILLAVGIATLLYVAVAAAAVMTVVPAALAESSAPLVVILERAGLPGARHFSAVAVVATTNGVLVEIMLVARLAYGMARRGLLPAAFGAVHPRTQTPVRATFAGGAAVLALVLLVPFETLAAATSVVMLAVFVAVDLALWRLKRNPPPPGLGVVVPGWVPPAAALVCLGLLAAAPLA